MVLIIKNADNITFSTYTDDNVICMSDWYNINSTCIDLFPLCEACYSYIPGVSTVKDFYYELVYGFSREYVRYPESYAFNAYHMLIKDIAEQNNNYYKEKYGYDYVVPEKYFTILLEEDDEWTLFELDDFELTDEKFEDTDVDDYNDDEDIEQIDYSDNR